MAGKRVNNRGFDGALQVTSKRNRISRKVSRKVKREGNRGNSN